jgi:formylmethanofuran dehydrogenase subunit B
MTDIRVEHVTCLGCGCACDDIAVTVRDGRIVDTNPACSVGRDWFADGVVPWEVLRDGAPASVEDAIGEAARVLAESQGRLLIYVGADLSSQAQRRAVSLADLLRGTVDSATSDTAAAGLLAAQRSGRATATLGEIRNRADVLLFWGVDPIRRYPRFYSRYAPDPTGVQVPNGRRDRFVIAINVGTDQGPAGADAALTLEPSEEIAALSLMRASIHGRTPADLGGVFGEAIDLASRLASARYAVLIHDAEATIQERNPLRVEGLLALTQALNGPTRAALCSLRAGGNRVGADAVLTWQSGYPIAVEYSRGYPRYAPQRRGLERLADGGFKAVLMVGSPATDEGVVSALERVNTIVIGPRASQSPFRARVAIDTGVAGIHEGGTGYRMDEVPLRLRPPLSAQRSAVETLDAIIATIRERAARP